MTTERLETIAVGSCPTCGGPAQVIDRMSSRDVEALKAKLGPGADVFPSVDYRHIRLANVDEDLGVGWRLTVIAPSYRNAGADTRWYATAARSRERGGVDVEYGFGETPAEAYLALRTTIERRPRR